MNNNQQRLIEEQKKSLLRAFACITLLMGGFILWEFLKPDPCCKPIFIEYDFFQIEVLDFHTGDRINSSDQNTSQPVQISLYSIETRDYTLEEIYALNLSQFTLEKKVLVAENYQFRSHYSYLALIESDDYIPCWLIPHPGGDTIYLMKRAKAVTLSVSITDSNIRMNYSFSVQTGIRPYYNYLNHTFVCPQVHIEFNDTNPRYTFRLSESDAWIENLSTINQTLVIEYYKKFYTNNSLIIPLKTDSSITKIAMYFEKTLLGEVIF